MFHSPVLLILTNDSLENTLYEAQDLQLQGGEQSLYFSNTYLAELLEVIVSFFSPC